MGFEKLKTKRAMKKYIILIFLLLYWSHGSYSSVEGSCRSVIQSLKNKVTQLSHLYKIRRAEEIPTGENFNRLEDLLNQNPSRDIQMRIIALVERFGRQVKNQLLLKILEQDSVDIEVQRVIVHVAGKIGTQEGVEVLLKILEQDSIDVRVQIAIANAAEKLNEKERNKVLSRMP